MIEQLLVEATGLFPAWVEAVLLGLAALSFVCRWRAQTRLGRIREYGARSLGVAAALGGLAILYVFIEADIPTLAGRPVVIRILLGLLATALVGFNWGGVRAVWRDVFRRDGSGGARHTRP